jgi:hypothetical protein
MNIPEASSSNSSLFLKILEDLQTVINLGTLIDRLDVEFKSDLMGLFELILRNNLSENNILNRCHNLLEMSKTLSWISTSSLITLYYNSFNQPQKENSSSIINKDPKIFASSHITGNNIKKSINKNEIQSFVERMIENKSCLFPLNTIKNSITKINSLIFSLLNIRSLRFK